MVGVSLVTPPPDSEKVRDNVFRRWREPWLGLRDYRAWAGLLFFGTVVLWWSFR